MFLLLIGILILASIAVIPIFADPDERQLWYRRIFKCQGWNDATATRQESQARFNARLDNLEQQERHRQRIHERGRTTASARRTGSSTTVGVGRSSRRSLHHYVMSEDQEEEIRHDFIRASLREYSMTLQANQVQSHQQVADEAAAASNNKSNDNSAAAANDLHRARADTSATLELSDAGDSSEELQLPSKKEINDNNDDVETDADIEEGFKATTVSSSPTNSTPSTSSIGDDDDDEEKDDVVVDYLAEINEDGEDGIVWVPAPGVPAPAVVDQNDKEKTGDAKESATDKTSDELECTKEAKVAEQDVEKATTTTAVEALNVNKEYHARTQTCSICLCHLEENDQVSWSANTECSHAFHTDCVHSWLAMAARRHLKRQRRRQARTGNIILRDDPITNILKVPMLCPCCRQPFLKVMDDGDKDDKEVGSISSSAELEGEDAQPTTSTSGSSVSSTTSPSFLDTSIDEASSQPDERVDARPSTLAVVRSALESLSPSSSPSESSSSSSTSSSSHSLPEEPESVELQHAQPSSSPTRSATATARPTTAELAISAMC